MSSLLNLKE